MGNKSSVNCVLHKDIPICTPAKEPKGLSARGTLLFPALFQFIPGGGILGDFFKGVAGGAITAYLEEGPNAYLPTSWFHNIWKTRALSTGLFAGSQVLTTNILTAAIIPQENPQIQDFINAIVAGIATWEVLYTASSSHKPWVKKWENYMEILYLGDEATSTPADPQKAKTLEFIFAFLVGFLAVRNNVATGIGGANLTPFMNGFLAGMGTVGSITPTGVYVAYEGGNPSGGGMPASDAVGTYLKSMIGAGALVGLTSMFTTGRFDPMTVQLVTGIVNYAVVSSEIMPRILGYWGTSLGDFQSWNMNCANPQNQNPACAK